MRQILLDSTGLYNAELAMRKIAKKHEDTSGLHKLEYILSAGQCAVGNSSAFVPDETVAGDRSTSNADRWICDFYDSTGGRQCGSVFGTGGSNDSTSMVHIRMER